MKTVYGIPLKTVCSIPLKPVYGIPLKTVYGIPLKTVCGIPLKTVYGIHCMWALWDLYSQHLFSERYAWTPFRYTFVSPEKFSNAGLERALGRPVKLQESNCTAARGS